MTHKYRRLTRAALVPLVALLALSVATVAQAKGPAPAKLSSEGVTIERSKGGGFDLTNCPRPKVCLYRNADFNTDPKTKRIQPDLMWSTDGAQRCGLVFDLGETGSNNTPYGLHFDFSNQMSSWVNRSDHNIQVYEASATQGDLLFTMWHGQMSHWVGQSRWEKGKEIKLNDTASSLWVRCDI